MTFRSLYCSSGLPLLRAATASNRTTVNVTRVVAASQQLQGFFQVAFKGSQFANVPVDATAVQLQTAMSSLLTGKSNMSEAQKGLGLVVGHKCAVRGAVAVCAGGTAYTVRRSGTCGDLR